MIESAKAIVFDLFGTLVSPPDGEYILSRLAELGIKATSPASSWIARGYPHATMMFEMGIDPSDALSLQLVHPHSRVEHVFELVESVFRTNCRPSAGAIEEAKVVSNVIVNGCAFYTGAEALLDKLKDAGMQMQLLSNLTGTYARVLEQLNITRWFPEPVLSCNSGKCKPAREAFSLALKGIEFPQPDVVMVGNNWKVDIIGALNFGLQAVFVDQSKRHPVRQLSGDATVLFCSDDDNKEITLRSDLGDEVFESLPFTRSDLQKSPTSHLQVDEEGRVRISALERVVIVDRLVELNGILGL